MFQLSPDHINFMFVFIEGVLSFFSPCVIPLIPIYASYLAGNTQEYGADGSVVYHQKSILFHTIFFIFGISTAFFLLGLSFSTLGQFFANYQSMIGRIGGIIIIVLGLIQLGIFQLPFLSNNHRLPLKINLGKINPWMAYLMGFTFSFAWTPCVGPALSSVLILASSAQNSLLANLLILTYTIGFILPFLALGLFTKQVLNFIATHKHLMSYTIKAGGVILILIGISTYTGMFNNITNYLNETNTPPPQSEQSSVVQRPAFDFTLTDQYGESHTLSDYEGKVVFLNFWASWCGPCRIEMPDIEKLYQAYGYNENDVVFLGVIQPNTSQETDIAGIKAFLEENNYTYPVVFDESGQVFADYSIRSYPTTFMIDTNGQRFGYISGALSEDIMRNIITQTIESTQ